MDDDGRFVVEVDNEVLGAPADAEDGASRDPREDVFGPVVNLAARIVKLAAPGEVAAPMSVARRARIKAEPLGQHRLKGFDGDIELGRLT